MLTCLWQCDDQRGADGACAYGEGCHAAVVCDKGAQVWYGGPCGIQRHLPRGPIPHISDVEQVVADDAILLVGGRGLPGEGEGGGSGLRGCQLCWCTSRNWVGVEKCIHSGIAQ